MIFFVLLIYYIILRNRENSFSGTVSAKTMLHCLEVEREDLEVPGRFSWLTEAGIALSGGRELSTGILSSPQPREKCAHHQRQLRNALAHSQRSREPELNATEACTLMCIDIREEEKTEQAELHRVCNKNMNDRFTEYKLPKPLNYIAWSLFYKIVQSSISSHFVLVTLPSVYTYRVHFRNFLIFWSSI